MSSWSLILLIFYVMMIKYLYKHPKTAKLKHKNNPSSRQPMECLNKVGLELFLMNGHLCQYICLFVGEAHDMVKKCLAWRNIHWFCFAMNLSLLWALGTPSAYAKAICESSYTAKCPNHDHHSHYHRPSLIPSIKG